MKQAKHVEQLTVSELIEQMNRNRICLPDFQRDFVWSPTQMAKLLESIIRQMPPLARY